MICSPPPASRVRTAKARCGRIETARARPSCVGGRIAPLGAHAHDGESPQQLLPATPRASSRRASTRRAGRVTRRRNLDSAAAPDEFRRHRVRGIQVSQPRPRDCRGQPASPSTGPPRTHHPRGSARNAAIHTHSAQPRLSAHTFYIPRSNRIAGACQRSSASAAQLARARPPSPKYHANAVAS